jgi:predicted acyl esterase
MEIGVPSFWFTSWYDVSITPNLALFNPVKNNSKDATIRDNQYLVIAPTLNCTYTRSTENKIVGERSVGDAKLNNEAQIYAWFDLWLKGKQNDFKVKTPRV